MKKNKKFLSAIIAAVMAFGMIVVPAEALAKDTPSVTKTNIAIFAVNNNKKTNVTLTGLTAKGKKKTSVTIQKKYKLRATTLGETYSSSKTYKVTKINAGAFSGSKAKTIRIKASLKPQKAMGMLMGSKQSKVTIKVPRAQVSAWKKAAAKVGYFGYTNSGKAIKVTIKKI